MTDLFLFGAGASFGSGPTVVSCGPHAGTPARLPLGLGLFDELEQEFDSWGRLSEELKAEFRRDFEPAFAGLSDDPDMPTLVRQMCLYFLKFEPLEQNLYIRFAKIMASRGGLHALATLNYDCLLEHALNRVRGGFHYGLSCEASTVHAPRGCGVLKVHGSPNFLPAITPTRGGPIFSGCETYVEAPVRVTEPRVAIQDLTAAHERNDRLMVPALALYAPGKPVLYCRRTVQSIQAEFSEACAIATRIFLVGVRLVEGDDHVWNPVAASDAEVVFVNPALGDAQVFTEWAAAKGVRSRWMQSTFDQFLDWLDPDLA